MERKIRFEELKISPSILKQWQNIIDIMAELADIPAALIMRIAGDKIEVFMTSDSEGNLYHPGDKEHLHNSGLYCETVVKTKQKLLVSNALEDEKWCNNPDVKLNMISYLGFPILLPNGEVFGTLCILDNKSNAYSNTIEQMMMKFRDLIQSHLELFYVNQILGDENKRFSDYLREIQILRGINTICCQCKKIKDKQGDWKPIEDYLIHHPEAKFSHGYCPQCAEDILKK